MVQFKRVRFISLLFIHVVVLFLCACNPFNSPAAKQGFLEISKMQIKTLVMHIEFYKLQHSHYPDNLQQIQDDDPLAPVTDALQATQENQNQFPFYNYERRGEKYTLVSSGTDGIAGTKDDFYPEINISDSSKIGLIRRQ